MNKLLNNIKKYKKEVITTLISFFIFFIIFRIAPVVNDGWLTKFNYGATNGFINHVIYDLVVLYQHVNGRISSNLIMGFVESFTSEILLDAFNAFVMTAIYVSICKIIKIKDNFVKGFILYDALLLLISTQMRLEVIFYANAAYVVPVLLLLLYYYYYKKLDTEEKDRINIIIMSILGFVICTWMEHIAVGFGCVITIMLIKSFIKKDKKKWKKTIPVIFSGVGGIIMMLSPALRTNRTILSNGSTLDVIKQNLMIFKNDIISNNLILFIMMFAIIIVLILTNKKINKFLKIISISIIGFMDTIFILIKASDYIKLPTIIYTIKDYINSPIFSYKQILFAIIIIFIILFSITIIKNKKISLYVFFITFFSLLVMCITPNSGARISSIGFFGLLILTIILYYNLPKNATKFINILSIILFVLAMDYYILMCRRIYNVEKTRQTIINEVVLKQSLGEWDYDKEVVLPLFNQTDLLNCGAATMACGTVDVKTFHYPYFLIAYNLHPNTKVVFKNFINEHLYVDFEKIENKININIINGEKYFLNYKYVIYKANNLSDYSIEYESEWSNGINYSYPISNQEYYKVKVYSINANNEIKILADNYIVKSN